MNKIVFEKNGFTLVELIIATGLLSLVIISAFSLSSSSHKSFEAGSWRINTQKEAQRFLLRFKETIEQANHANLVAANGNVTRVGGARNVTIASPWYNKVASSTNSGILFASSSVPARAASPELGSPAKNGIWKGIGLECFNKTLAFYQTGDWNSMLPSAPISAGSADVARFVLNNRNGDFTITLNDVESLGIFVQTATDSVDLNRPEMLLSLRLIMIKPNSGGKIKLTEEIIAKISDRKASEIVSGASSYKVSKRRK
ncbi:MAG: prepilin-type N-terminal cleavage/methylation domain-containing protein [Candidatus Riflebacteria bacterium]|nr:prepilin-type N-terminal cleavage/methylation domain-containing protein [Candidatus Riflebacteria bacterium]